MKYAAAISLVLATAMTVITAVAATGLAFHLFALLAAWCYRLAAVAFDLWTLALVTNGWVIFQGNRRPAVQPRATAQPMRRAR